MKFSFARIVLAAALATVSATALVPVATAQVGARKPRMLQGTVTDGGGAPMDGAIVYLKNTSNLAIKTYVAEKGEYHFGQLGTDSDYQVWAEYKGRKSAVKTISALENKPEFNVALKLK